MISFKFCRLVTIITFCHGTGLGWFAPMLFKLQTPSETPLDFVVSVEQGSWMGALVNLGGFTGNVLFGLLLDLIGRKACIYSLALPHIVSLFVKKLFFNLGWYSMTLN